MTIGIVFMVKWHTLWIHGVSKQKLHQLSAYINNVFDQNVSGFVGLGSSIFRRESTK